MIHIAIWDQLQWHTSLGLYMVQKFMHRPVWMHEAFFIAPHFPAKHVYTLPMLQAPQITFMTCWSRTIKIQKALQSCKSFPSYPYQLPICSHHTTITLCQRITIIVIFAQRKHHFTIFGTATNSGENYLLRYYKSAQMHESHAVPAILLVWYQAAHGPTCPTPISTPAWVKQFTLHPT